MNSKSITSLLAGAIILWGCSNSTTNDSANNTTSQTNAGTTVQPVAFQLDTCEALPDSTGNIIEVDSSQTNSLQNIINSAQEGDTIELADGTYDLDGQYLWISTPGITLRSASGNPNAVILDGNYSTTEIITIDASNVTIAELTITHPNTHGLHVINSAAASTEDTLIYRVNVIDPREQAIKINQTSTSSEYYADNGTIACSSLRLTDEGRPNVNPYTGCYTGGIDAHRAQGWTIQDNTIEGFWCETGLSEHGVHLWRGSADTLVQRNRFIDNARAIGFGMASSGEARTYSPNRCSTVSDETYIDHYGGMIVNNIISNQSTELAASSSGVDCLICLWSACDAQVYHNTLFSSAAPFSDIEWRFSASQNIDIANNIYTRRLMARENAGATLASNIQLNAEDLFINSSNLDFHLQSTASAINQGTFLNLLSTDEDFDKKSRDNLPDPGAYEYRPQE